MKSERSFSRCKFALQNPLAWYLLAVAVFLVLVLAGCSHYNPALFPSYDVLNPGSEVRLNPIAFTADGNLIVSPAFILWVFELKAEVLRLRKGK